MPTFTGAKAKLICSYMFDRRDNLFVTVFMGSLHLEPEGYIMLRDKSIRFSSAVIAAHAIKRIRLSCRKLTRGSDFFKEQIKQIEEEAACRST